ncbi:hypothetical protein BKG82_26425 [Mycobacteroides chelonae]|uniref:Uncharacterized protein n=1 Tax=Mycobacteroides chelonae TaxID=1774 RepID=A0A1S1LKS0_MYCCH|nr:hypothetical protein BKG82_26425 [Mycobacteroides chelonae]
MPDVAGAGTSTLHDVLRSQTVNPFAAFGAAAALQRVAGRDSVNQALNRWAGKTPEAGADAAKAGQGLSDAERLKNIGLASPNESASAAKPASAPASVADSKAAGRQAVKEAQKTLAKDFAENSARVAVKEASLLAARNGAKFGAAMALRLLALGTPGVGTALTLALWAFDTDGRRAFNNLISSMLGVGAAPDLNAPPQPPRTKFLPITNDGNRDDTIEKMDHGMATTNERSFGFNPDDVWPTVEPNIPTTSQYGGFRAQMNQLGAHLKSALEAPEAVYQSYRDEPYVAKMWAKTKPGVDAMGEVHSKVLPQMGTKMLAAATATNNAYQAFRQVNLNNRAEISNSTSGLIPGRANHVNAGKMSDSTDEMKQSLSDIDRIAQELATLADPITIVANRVSGGDSSPRTDGKPQAEPQPQQPAAPVAPPAAPPAAKPDVAKDLASQLLGRGVPGFGNPMSGMGAPSVPQVPVPPGLGQALGGAKPFQPLKDDKDKEKELRDKLAEKLKPKDEKEPMKPEGPPQAGPPAGTGAGAGKPVKTPLGKPGDPKASNTVTVDGRPWKFDNPKLAQFVNNLANPEGGAHKSVRQSAIDAGYHLPPLDKDIGKPISESEMKPGAVIMGPDNRNAVFLGETGGQAMVRTEAGETTTLDKVLGTGAHVGIFELLDDGAAAGPADQGQVQQASAQNPSGAPAGTPPGSPSTADTDPGLISGQQRAATGLNPGNVTPGN